MNVDNFYVQLASEADPERVLKMLGGLATGDRRIFVGVIDPIDPRVETPEKVRDRVLHAARHIDPSHLGTTDDCGFSPFGDDTSTSRDTAFAKIAARVDRDGDGVGRARGLTAARAGRAARVSRRRAVAARPR